jgi:hypothetical protein
MPPNGGLEAWMLWWGGLGGADRCEQSARRSRSLSVETVSLQRLYVLFFARHVDAASTEARQFAWKLEKRSSLRSRSRIKKRNEHREPERRLGHPGARTGVLILMPSLAKIASKSRVNLLELVRTPAKEHELQQAPDDEIFSGTGSRSYGQIDDAALERAQVADANVRDEERGEGAVSGALTRFRSAGTSTSTSSTATCAAACTPETATTSHRSNSCANDSRAVGNDLRPTSVHDSCFRHRQAP